MLLNVAEAMGLHQCPPRTESGRTLDEETRVDDQVTRDRFGLLIDPADASADERATLDYLLSRDNAARAAAQFRLSIGAGLARAAEHGSHSVGAIDAAGNLLAATHTVYGDAWGDTGLFVGGIALNSSALQYTVKRPQPGGRLNDHLSC